MKHYKSVILRSTSGNKINIPKDAWEKLGWNLNDKLTLSFGYNGWDDDAEPICLKIEKREIIDGSSK
tara:strand:- start:166 stop:366 length:201 start_codon:yes stop_codon:yes gene_type:complete